MAITDAQTSASSVGSTLPLTTISFFTREYIRKFYRNKHIVFIGDSLMRHIYRDFICHLQHDRLVTPAEMWDAFTSTSLGDQLLNASAKASNKVEAWEHRMFVTDDAFTKVEYWYMTRCFGVPQMNYCLNELKTNIPDVILMNSMLWDLARFNDAETDYHKNVFSLMRTIKQFLPSDRMFIWMSTPPCASHQDAGYLQHDIADEQGVPNRIHILRNNQIVAQIAVQWGFDVLDVATPLRHMMWLRYDKKPSRGVDGEEQLDGVHWMPPVQRHITDLLATHLHAAWHEKLPVETVRKICILKGTYPPASAKQAQRHTRTTPPKWLRGEPMERVLHNHLVPIQQKLAAKLEEAQVAIRQHVMDVIDGGDDESDADDTLPPPVRPRQRRNSSSQAYDMRSQQPAMNSNQTHDRNQRSKSTDRVVVSQRMAENHGYARMYY